MSRLYTLTRTPFTHNYNLVLDSPPAPNSNSNSNSTPPNFHIHTSLFAHSKPTLTLHAGPDNSGPVLAACFMPRLSANLKIALGDPDAPDARFEDLDRRHGHALSGEYHFFLDVPGPAGPERRPFCWKRTHSVAVEGRSPSSFGGRDYKLVDEMADGRVVAIFSGQRSLRTCGQLQLDVDCGSWFDIAVIMTCVSMHEKSRRRKAGAAAAAAA